MRSVAMLLAVVLVCVGCRPDPSQHPDFREETRDPSQLRVPELIPGGGSTEGGPVQPNQ